MMIANEVPTFDFDVPLGYSWLVRQNLVGFAPNTQLQPWHFLPPRQIIDLKTRWPSGPSDERLIAFAKRQDCDDLACFEISSIQLKKTTKEQARRVVLVHGWTNAGYDIVLTLDDFWSWLKVVVDDLADWAESNDSP